MLADYLLENYIGLQAKQYMGIFGNPIKHTLSPIIHDTLSDAFSLDAKYVPFEIPKDKLDDCVKEAYDNGMLGLNITVPYKQQVMDSLVGIDEDARMIGAVNTLVRAEGGFCGYNTDMPGLARAIASEGIEISGSKVIILGAGGAARAATYMCLKYYADTVYIVNRTFQKAKQLADDMNYCFSCDSVIPVASSDYKSIPQDKYLMLQCTSVGLHEGDELLPVMDKTFYTMASAGVDLLYNPAKTPFLSLLDELDIPCYNGLKMLLYQGIMAYELWNHVKVCDSLAQTVYKRLCKKLYGDKIVLVGYMGAGKTTIGREIAKRNGYTFVDTDEIIEKREKMKISEIFEQYGEAWFRDKETKLLRELSSDKADYVISTGGGIPLRPVNRKLVKSLGKVYYLQADADTIYNRVKNDTSRPLLACEDLYSRIQSMLAKRDEIYRQVANECINTAILTPVEIAVNIIEKN